MEAPFLVHADGIATRLGYVGSISRLASPVLTLIAGSGWISKARKYGIDRICGEDKFILCDKEQAVTALREDFARWEELIAGLSEEQLNAPLLR